MSIVEIFNYQNPWRTKPKFKVEPFFQRSVLSLIQAWMKEPEIIVLIGPRQSGKTTILHKLIELQLNAGTSPEKIFFFNCDNFAIRSLFDDVSEFLSFVNQMNPKQNSFIYIDEVQRLPNPGIFLKQLFDLQAGMKIIVSGSSSLEIKSKIKESLTGRKIVFPVLPFSLVEFLRTDNSYSPLLKASPTEIIANFDTFDKIWGNKLLSDLDKYLIFGGYPRVIVTSNIEKKKQLLHEIFSSYVQKDVSDFMKIEKIQGFNKLVQILAVITGQLINKSDLALKAGLNMITMEKYLQILQDTFIVEKISPYFSNKMKEIVKNPKIYFLDSGLRNAILSDFNPLSRRQDSGFVLEILAYRELKSLVRSSSDIKFWRTKAGAEVDFVINFNNELIPIECKSLLRRPILGRSFINFINYYNPKMGVILNANLFSETKIGKTKVYFIPYHWFPLIKNELFK